MKNISRMRTKTFLIGFLFCTAFPGTSFSQFSFIDETKWYCEDNRSINSSPVLEQNGNTITIYSNKTLTNLSLEIRNLSGIILYQTVITIPAGMTYSINTTELAFGDYTIKITQGEKYILGYFNK